MKILLVDDDIDIREILEFTFTCEIEADFLHADSGQNAIEVLKNHSDISFVVCDYNMPNGSGGDVYKHLLETNNSTPYFMCSSDQAIDHPEFEEGNNFKGEITKPYIYEGVVKCLKIYDELTGKANTLKENSLNYLPISLEILLKMSKLPCPLHIELNSGKIIKILNTEDEFTSEEYDKYVKKGVERLVIEKGDAQEFVNGVCREVTSILNDAERSEENKVFDAHSVIMSTVSELGLSEKVIRAATQSVDHALGLFDKTPGFDKISKHIFGYPGKYLTTHSIALSYIAVSLLKNTNWDNHETRNKMVLAAFLHDASIKTPEFTEQEFVDETKMVHITSHPKDIQNLLEKIKNLPPDVDRILLEHHERPNGSGYPKQLTGDQLHILSCVFIFSHDIVNCIYKLKIADEEVSDASIRKMMNKDEYTTKNFKKCFNAFEKLTIF